jgi:Beta-glucanase/Beta-glucan synthetase
LVVLFLANSCASNVIFTDNFNSKTQQIDTSIWKLCPYANNAWSQHFKYVNGYQNVRIEDGNLVLKAIKEDGNYKNGGVKSSISFPNFTRVEVRAKLNKKVRGGFPAIWQMPVGAPTWPKGGEVDIMEWIQGTPNQIYQTVHSYYINETSGTTGATNLNPDKNFDVTQYHIYAADRTDEAVIFYVDGKETFRYENKNLSDDKLQFPFNKYNFNIILNFSLGGLLNGNNTWPGAIYDEDLPGEMWVDWVKVTKIK